VRLPGNTRRDFASEVSRKARSGAKWSSSNSFRQLGHRAWLRAPVGLDGSGVQRDTLRDRRSPSIRSGSPGISTPSPARLGFRALYVREKLIHLPSNSGKGMKCPTLRTRRNRPFISSGPGLVAKTCPERTPARTSLLGSNRSLYTHQTEADSPRLA